jgi:hypothetical protein
MSSLKRANMPKVAITGKAADKLRQSLGVKFLSVAQRA